MHRIKTANGLFQHGDTIVYTKFSATEIEHNSEQFFVVTERDIIAIVED